MTTSELQDLIGEGEGFFVEFKRQIDSAIDIASEIVAFANTEGGILIIGVGDDGTVYGTDDPDLTERRLIGICRDSVIPAIVPEIETAVIEPSGQRVVIARIPKGLDKPYRTKTDHYYIRAGSIRRRTTKEELARLFQEAGFVHYDISPVPGTSPEDLDMVKIAAYFRQFYDLELDRLESDLPLERLLSNAKILILVGSEYRVSVGGILCFAKRPQDILFASGITAARYAGTDVGEELVDRKDITGTIPEIIDLAEAWVKIHNLTPSHIEGMKRIDRPQYVDRVVREAIVNAVAHRNYSITGSRIRILIFDDRLEVRSPGRLPNTVTLEGIRYGDSFIRNQFIVKMLSQHRYVDVLGRGIPMMIRLTRAHAGREPVFEEVAEEFRVIIPAAGSKAA